MAALWVEGYLRESLTSAPMSVLQWLAGADAGEMASEAGDAMRSAARVELAARLRVR
jgi:hypothetical protein